MVKPDSISPSPMRLRDRSTLQASTRYETMVADVEPKDYKEAMNSLMPDAGRRQWRKK